MMRLQEPKFDYESTLDICIQGITGNTKLREKLSNNKINLLTEGEQYIASANAGQLYMIKPIDNNIAVDVADLSKTGMIKVYSQYLVGLDKPARKIYDALLNAAQEKCPFCGGIGTPRNLDHFLPKAHFPQFSVFPKNLVPSCRDCNMDGKSEAFACTAEEQLIQPYVDNDQFFNTQWIFARYETNQTNKPGWFHYYVKPPDGWSKVDTAKIQKHFSDFDLAKRFGIKAGQELSCVWHQIEEFKRLGFENEINSLLLRPRIENALFINHWQRGMYQALMDVF